MTRIQPAPPWWADNRNMFIVVAIGAVCFLAGLLIAAPRLQAGSRQPPVYAAPSVTVQAPGPARPAAVASLNPPSIQITPVKEASADTTLGGSELSLQVQPAEKPRHHKRKRPKVEKAEEPAKEQTAKDRTPSEDPVVVYDPAEKDNKKIEDLHKANDDLSREIDDSFREEVKKESRDRP